METAVGLAFCESFVCDDLAHPLPAEAMSGSRINIAKELFTAPYPLQLKSPPATADGPFVDIR
jgi:hypothetical protein